MRPAFYSKVCLALLFCALAQGPAMAQKPTAADTRELVAVMELDGVNANKSQLAALTEELRAQLLQSGKFRVVDRQQIDALLKEQAFQQTGCTSQECAIQVGKILGVRKMVVGRVTRIEDGLWQLSAQMVDAETAETVRAVTYKHEGKFSTLLDQGMAALAAKLTGTAGAPAAIATAKSAPESVAPVDLAAGQTLRDPATGMEFVRVPGGSFEMGCGSWDRDCRDDEKPPHQVTVAEFWLGKTEVTQGQWTRIMGSNPSSFKKGDNYPVERVSWDDAQEFIQRVNGQSSGASFRLPTEAEWEFACRAGGNQQIYGTQTGNLYSDAANYGQGRKGATKPVANYAPNGLGLYDMSGNVGEWVQDSYDSGGYAHMAAVNPLNSSGDRRVFRGGSWYDPADSVRCSSRHGLKPSFGNGFLTFGFAGFRLVKTN